MSKNLFRKNVKVEDKAVVLAMRVYRTPERRLSGKKMRRRRRN